jgi:hypothetical protein
MRKGASRRCSLFIRGSSRSQAHEARQITERPTDFSGGVAPYAIDAGNAERLWDVALKLIS